MFQYARVQRKLATFGGVHRTPAVRAKLDVSCMIEHLRILSCMLARCCQFFRYAFKHGRLADVNCTMNKQIEMCCTKAVSYTTTLAKGKAVLLICEAQALLEY